MKVTVNKYLNARTGSPSVNSINPFYRSPGFILEIDDTVIGDEIDGNSIWYHCKEDGCYYWSGGFAEYNFSLGKRLINYEEKAQIAILRSLQNDKQWELKKKIVGYIGNAVGLKNDDLARGKALVIYVDIKQSDIKPGFPGEIPYKGILVPTDVKEMITSQHHSYSSRSLNEQVLLDNDFPLQMGGSISPEGGRIYGTRSLKLIRKGDYFLLTCFHVLLNDLKKDSNYVSKPQAFRYATYPCAALNIHKTPRKLQITEGKYNQYYDYAVTLLNKHDDVINTVESKKFSGFYDASDMHLLMGRQVTMVGATSCKQQGKVTDINASICIGNNSFSFLEIIVCDRISTGGDSGAPVVDDNNKLIGLVIGGNDVNRTFIIPIYRIISKQDYLIDY